MYAKISLDQLLQEAIVNGGIFRNHLWHYWVKLQKEPSLVEALAAVMSDRQSVLLNPIQAYKLESQGLIHRKGRQANPGCELYRVYFQQQLSAI